jgi:hypothetical protein
MTGARKRRGRVDFERAGPGGPGNEPNILVDVVAEPGGLLLPEDTPELADDSAIPKDRGDIGGVSDEPLPDPESVFEPGDIGESS